MSVLLVLLYITLNGLAIEIALHKSCEKNAAGFTGDRIFSIHRVFGTLCTTFCDIYSRQAPLPVRTPLHAAAAGYGSVEVVRVLLEHGANVGAEDNQGRTPFQLASALASAQEENGIMEVLLEHGAHSV